MGIDFKMYQLRCELPGHKDHVVGICLCGNAIATSSRDRTVRIWSLDSSQGYALRKVLRGDSSFAGSMAWIEPSKEFPEGRIVTPMDSLVLVWDVKTGEKVQTLKGHQSKVTGVAFDNGDIVSSSVDKTIKRWRNGRLVESWEGHKAAIQAVIKHPSGELVTCSSDCTLKIWKGTTCTRTSVGHTDAVRGLAVMSELGVLSASHDGSIRLWARTGELLTKMVGHASAVCSVDCYSSGLTVSSSEDCSSKIWKDGLCVQSIEHPSFVWDAKFLENGDIVTACSDGVTRIWSQLTISRVRMDKITRTAIISFKLHQMMHTSSDGRSTDNGLPDTADYEKICVINQNTYATMTGHAMRCEGAIQILEQAEADGKNFGQMIELLQTYGEECRKAKTFDWVIALHTWAADGAMVEIVGGCNVIHTPNVTGVAIGCGAKIAWKHLCKRLEKGIPADAECPALARECIAAASIEKSTVGGLIGYGCLSAGLQTLEEKNVRIHIMTYLEQNHARFGNKLSKKLLCISKHFPLSLDTEERLKNQIQSTPISKNFSKITVLGVRKDLNLIVRLIHFSTRARAVDAFHKMFRKIQGYSDSDNHFLFQYNRTTKYQVQFRRPTQKEFSELASFFAGSQNII